MNYFNDILDFLLPRFCFNCDKKLNKQEIYLCKYCFDTIDIARDDFIQYEFNRKFKSENLINDFYSPFMFEKDEALQSLIHSLKYSKNFRIGIYLGEYLGSSILEKRSEWKIDIILPVPLHKLKKAERGFNQSFYIAKGVNNYLGKRLIPKLLKRTRYTETQTNKNLQDRKLNMKKAFTVKDKSLIENKSILIIDDVITTGSTISECAKVLKDNGAANIYAASVGIAEM